MISCQMVPVTQKDEEELRLWLRRREFGVLVQVMEAHVKSLEADALKTALESGPHNMKLEQSNGHLQEAQKWADSIIRLKQLAAQSSPFTLAKLS